MHFSPPLPGLGLTLLAALIVASAPGAAHAVKPTASAITSPADPVHLAFDADLPGVQQDVTITGSSNGSAPDLVDIACVYGTVANVIASNVPLDGEGRFSVTAPYKDVIDDNQPCRLRALPDGHPGSGDVDAFTGPRLDGLFIDPTSGTAPVHGGGTINYDFYSRFSGPGAAGILYSAGSDALVDHVGVSSPGLRLQDEETWIGGGALYGVNDAGSGTSIVADGRSAWLPYGLPSRDFDGAGPEPFTKPTGTTGTTTSFQHSPGTGDVRVVETSNLHVCADPSVFPPTVASCSTVSLVGVRLQRVTRIERDGRLVHQTDSFTSTDGQPHQLRLEYYNEAGAASSSVWRFPGDADFTFYDAGDEIAGSAEPVTAHLGDAEDQHGAEVAPGAMVWGGPTERFRADRYFNVNAYARLAVPAGGAATRQQSFVIGRTRAQATALAEAAEAELRPVPAPVQPPVADPVTTPVAVVPPPATCTVPRVRAGSTQSAAKAALKRAGCAVGKVTRKHSRTKAGRVIRLSRRAGTTVAVGTKVGLTVSKGTSARRKRS